MVQHAATLLSINWDLLSIGVYSRGLQFTELCLNLYHFIFKLTIVKYSMVESNRYQGRLRVRRAGGKASSEGTSMYTHVPPQGSILVFKLLARSAMLSMLVS